VRRSSRMFALCLEDTDAPSPFQFMQSLPQYLARHRTSRKQFSRLHADYLQEIRMSTPVSSNNVTANDAPSSPAIQRDNLRGISVLGRRAEPANAATVSPERGITPVSSQVEVGAIKPVDRRTITGSYDGQTDKTQYGNKDVVDMSFAKNSPGPRDGMR